MIRVVHPRSGSRIRILIFYPSRITDPGVKKAPDPGCKTSFVMALNFSVDIPWALWTVVVDRLAPLAPLPCSPAQHVIVQLFSICAQIEAPLVQHFACRGAHIGAMSLSYKSYDWQSLGISRGGRKVQLIDLPIPIWSSDCIGRYNRLMSSSDFCISRLCRFVLSSDSFIDRSCFLVLSSDFCIWRLCRPVLSKKLLYRYFICS